MSNDHIKTINVADEMSKSFLDYSMSVIISRALPDARDGLKPSQRRVLYSMHHDLSLTPSKAHLKCARIVGDTMGKYHPHGDSSIYSTLVNMAQPWTMRETLVDGQGNFGSVEGDAAAAMRYTEARMTHMGSLMMTDLDKNTVDHSTTYDENGKEPTVLPASIPNLLVNGGTGIAVGMATNIPAHNLSECIDGACALIDNPDLTVDELQQIIKGPDFANECDIIGYRGVDSYFRTGRGSIKMRGRMDINEPAGKSAQIIITHVPHGVNRATLQERISELVREKVLVDIASMRDLSDEQTRIEITLKRDANPEVVKNQLYKLTAMETSFGVNMLAIDQRRPRQLSVMDALDCFIEHRRDVIIRRTKYLLDEARKTCEILESYMIAKNKGRSKEFLDNISQSGDRQEAIKWVADYDLSVKDSEGMSVILHGQPQIKGDKYVFSRRQAEAVVNLRAYQFTDEEREKSEKEYYEVMERVKDYLDILAKEERVLTIIKDELLEIKEKHGNPRRCPILPDEGEIAIEDLIANDSFIVTLSHTGYIKRTSEAEYRVQARGGKGVKGMDTRTWDEDEDKDFVEHLFSAQAHDYIMLFTNTGRVYVKRIYDIPEAPRTSRGRNIKNILDLQPEENIAAVLRLEYSRDEDGEPNTFREGAGFVFFATRSGKVKKTALNEYRNYRKVGINAINIDEGNELIDVRLTSGDDEVVLVTREGLSIRFPEDQARAIGRNSAGYMGIRPRDGDYVVGMAIVKEDNTLMIASENGLGKRSDFGEYRIQSRGGKGVKTLNVTEKTGKVVRGLSVSEEDELMLMTSGGQSIRIRVASVRQTGRVAQGVKLLTLKKGELLQDIARVVKDDSEDAVELDEEGNPIVNEEGQENAEASEAPEETSEES